MSKSDSLNLLSVDKVDAPTSCLTETEQYRILVEWNATQVDYPQAACLHHLIEAQVEKTPTAIALQFEDHVLTYDELNRRSNQLAHYLQSLRIQPERAVGICIERSLDMVVGLLGILKAGGAYVPLDPTYPADRLAHIVSDAQLSIVITQEKLRSVLPNSSAHAICLDIEWDAIAQFPITNPLSPVTSRNLAYIIYTSGSTGKPKGVLIEHRGAVNTNIDINRRFGVQAGDRLLAVCSLNFDLSVYDIFGLLGTGGTVVIPKPAIAPDLQDWMTLMERHHITIWNSAPPVMQMFANYLLDRSGHFPASLKLVMLSGDWIPITLPDVIRKLKVGSDPVAIISLGGATEASIWSIFYPITKIDPTWKSIPYGRPLANQKFHILNDQLQPVPVGDVGELFIGGDGVARGYLNRPDLNQTKFIPDPFSTQPDATLYRTGDLGRYQPDGTIEFLGRIDHQVKIRGFRVEIGEIEVVLAQQGSMRDMAILVREDQPGNPQLVAYLVPDRDQAPSVWRSLQPDSSCEQSLDEAETWVTKADWITDLRRYLQTQLPHYMVPAAFVVLPQLPLTPNGKLDRRALPAPDPTAYLTEETSDPPRTPLEQSLGEIWALVLGQTQIGVHDHFFNLGGHSLLATQVISKIRQALGIELPLQCLFEAPTLAELTGVVLQQWLQQLSPEEFGALSSDTCVPNDPIQCLATIAELSIEERSGLEQRLMDWQGLKTSTEKSFCEIARRDTTQPVRMSLAQQRLWIVNQLEELGAAYNIPLVLQFEGALQIDSLAVALTEIVRRHEVLRTNFCAVEGVPLQIIHPLESEILISLDLDRSLSNGRSLSPDEKEDHIHHAIATEIHRLFDLERDRLLRAKLFEVEENIYLLVITMHHIVSDGWSLSVFIHELTTFYNAWVTQQPLPLPELSIQYADFAQWQRQWLTEPTQSQQLNYWKTELAGSPPLLELPTDRPRLPQCSYRGRTQSFTLTAEQIQELNRMSQASGATLFMTLLASFSVLLWRYSGQEDIVVGSPIANRNRIQTESLIGFFVNMLAIRTQLQGDLTFLELLERVRQKAIAAYAHQDVSFEQIVEGLHLERNLSYHPVFQVLFVLQNVPIRSLEFQGLQTRWIPAQVQASQFDLSLYMEETEDGLRGFWEYNTDLFDDVTIQRLTNHFVTLLDSIVENPSAPIAQLPLLTAQERQQLITDWNQTQVNYPALCIHQLIAAQVERSPHAIAVQFEDQELTYEELDRLSNQLAHQVRSLGIGADDLVGIFLHRSVDMLVALLAVLKAGGAYVPLDPHYPQDRIAYVLDDAKVSVLLTQTTLLASLPQTQATVINLDEAVPHLNRYPTHAPEVSVSPDHLAYVIYTSGSTGRPKGVQIIHRAGVNFLTAMCQTPGIKATDTILAVTTLSFDIAVLELFAPLCVGAKTVIVSRAVASDGRQLADYLTRVNATILQATPASWRMVLDAGWQGMPTLKMLCGGEPLPRDLANQLLQRGGELWNLYGPTETTVWSAASQVFPSDEAVWVGPAIANTELYVLDESQQLVPIGVAGELYIGGDGLARGYLNRPDLTAEKFIPHPFHSDSTDRLYRTGDRVRYRQNGQLEFLGRIDFQVKIRGFRIELGEIESLLCQHPQVKQSVVAVQSDENRIQRLVAYLIPTQESPSSQQLRLFLREKLPEYMVPSVFVSLGAFPLTPNGKVDRKALPIPDAIRQDETAIVLPQNDLELKLVRIWEQLLNIHPISTHDNFFDLGGNSLLAAQVVDQIQVHVNQLIPLATIFHSPTVQQLAEGLQGEVNVLPWRSLVPLQTQGDQPPLFLFEGVGIYQDLATSLGGNQPVYGLAIAVNDDTQARPESIEALAAHYIEELRTVQPHGPYVLGGISWGGIVAYEVAQQLKAEGEQIALVILLDSILPHAYRKRPILERLMIHGQYIRQEGLSYLTQRISHAGDDWWHRLNRLYGTWLERFGLTPSYKVGYFLRHEWLARIMENYVARPYAGSVLLCRAVSRSDDAMVKLSPGLGWEPLISAADLSIFDVPSDHLEIIETPHVHRLATYLRDRMCQSLESAPIPNPIPDQEVIVTG